MLSELDVVRLKNDLPEERLAAGMIGTIVLVHNANPPAYEVEFADKCGRTIAMLALPEDALEFVWKFNAKS